MIDEEEPFEMTLDAVAVDDIRTPTNQHILDKPTPLDRQLTEVSKRYDRDNKGYLDEAEMALRKMDSKNRGYLDPTQVYDIMRKFQAEQVKSNELVESVREQHKHAVSLKRTVFALTFFVVALAITNIGTSFVAVRLVQDTRVAHGDLVAMNGQRLGTTSKFVEFPMSPLKSDLSGTRRRHLQDLQSFVCGDETDTDYSCTLQGEIRFTEAVALYKEFCPMWPNMENTCQGDGVSELMLNCNGVRSKVYGGLQIPPRGPALDTLHYAYMVLPSEERGYKAQQAVYNPNGTTQSQGRCMQNFEMGMYCETTGINCYVFATYDLTDACPGEVLICGDP